MNKLTERKCEPCEGGTPSLTNGQISNYLGEVPGWEVAEDNKQIEREFVFENFQAALDFINSVGKIAEAEGHHPNIQLYNYKYVKIILTTHAIGGLSDNDFILAAKIDELPTIT